ncbi:TraR/DksA C4-type zinc finger protein [Salmonella enterica]|nr:TraR/DksA C4-type zinc finger protein [Salmonella enterica]
MKSRWFSRTASSWKPWKKPARRQLRREGESLSECECCGNDIPLRRQQTIPGVRTCTECQRVLEIRNKHYQR